jgi:curved DNA-binding protein
MEYKDYYKILGVSKSATNDEIKKKYRQLARKYHPDVSKEKNAEEKFKEIQEAYTVLKDPEKRKTYDHVGQYSAGGGPFGGGFSAEQMRGGHAGGFHFQQAGGDFSGFSDFFEQLFGGGMQGRRGHAQSFKVPGQDQHAKVELTLEEAYAGGMQLLTLREPVINAQGQVQHQTKQLKVKIPQGVTEGTQIRLAGQGSPGQNGGAKGDLYLEIHLKPNTRYTVNGADVLVNVPITPWEAALGASIAVPTLGGKVKIKIPSGAKNGQKLRLKGRGLPSKSPGDEYVVLKIDVPEPKTEEQRKLYEKMAQLMPFNPRQHLE